MTLDTNDLRVVFREHATTVTNVPDFVLSAAARGRRTQQRRAAAGIGGAAVVVAAIVGITQLGGGSHRAAVPTAPKGFATYSSGMKLVEAKEGASPLDFDVKLPATADGKRTAVGVSLSCAAPSAKDSASHLEPSINLAIDGESEGAVTGCYKAFPASSAVTISWDPKDKSFAPGSTLRVHVGLSGKTPSDARIRVGVYAAVPLDQYVFPPAPAHLTPVTRSEGDSEAKVIGAIKADGPTTLVVHPKAGLGFDTTTSEPGQLDIYVDGKLVETTDSWTYEESGNYGVRLSLKQLGLKAGQPATVRVVPTRYTGATWLVSVTDESGP
jgi:hypothetical protein